MAESQECDRCNATIAVDIGAGRRPYVFSLRMSTEDGFNIHQRVLCDACEEDMLNWIDGDYNRENAVDLPDAWESGEMFRRFAQDLEDMADEISTD